MSTLAVKTDAKVGSLTLNWPKSSLDLLSTLFVLIVSVVLFSAPLRHSGNLLPYAQDDLYYYLVVARNLAHGLGSTFDGVTPTNGYHPLYLLLLWAVSKGSTSLISIFRFLWFLDVVAAITTFLAVRAIFARAFANRWLTNGFAFIVLWMSCYRFYNQMEVTLVMPLGFFLLLLIDRAPETITARRWAAIGLIASLLILSRLDTGLLVALCGIGVLWQRAYRQTLSPSKIFGFLAGCVPLLLLYLWTNHHFFGVFMPISGAAKQLRTSHGLYLGALRVSLTPGTDIEFFLSFLALCWLALHLRRLTATQRLICAAGLLFPFVHWGINTLLSDWMFWPWYKYSLNFSMAMLCVLIGLAMAHQSSTRLAGPAIFALGALLLSIAHYRPDAMMVDVADGARFTQQFAKGHPGRYAMGDRAGMVGYILDRPMIQTEGLMMDTVFLNHIRTREPLLSVLRAYRADYYVGFEPQNHKRAPGRCFKAVEPAQAGPSSPAMTAMLCDPPVAEFRVPSGRTLIFDLHTIHDGKPATISPSFGPY